MTFPREVSRHIERQAFYASTALSADQTYGLLATEYGNRSTSSQRDPEVSVGTLGREVTLHREALLSWLGSLTSTHGVLGTPRHEETTAGFGAAALRHEVLLSWVANVASTVRPPMLVVIDPYVAPSSTALPQLDEGSGFASALLKELEYWANAEDSDSVNQEEAAASMNRLLAQAGGEGFLVLYDLLSHSGRLPVAHACTLMSALSRTEEPLVRKYRVLLIRQALKNASPAVRDSAALAAYDGRIVEAVPLLKAAVEVEPVTHVRRSISDILGALNA